MESKSLVEKVSGSTSVSAGVTVVAAISGTWLAALLPVFTTVIASGRFQKRIEDAIQDINRRLEVDHERINNLSDQQFKLVNESLQALFSCTDDEKIALLKTAAVNSVCVEDLDAHEATVLSRALREVSAVEMYFLRKIVVHKELMVVSRSESKAWEKPEEAEIFPIEAGSSDNAILAGLANLGLVISTGSGFGGTINYRPSNTARRLVELVGL